MKIHYIKIKFKESDTEHVINIGQLNGEYDYMLTHHDTNFTVKEKPKKFHFEDVIAIQKIIQKYIEE
jgi:hypothetical protein